MSKVLLLLEARVYCQGAPSVLQNAKTALSVDTSATATHPFSKINLTQSMSLGKKKKKKKKTRL